MIGIIDWSRKLEAAPRFELGMKVLQTSALPLGYAALSIKKNGFPCLKETQKFLKARDEI
jgi:hypothetical protein